MTENGQPAVASSRKRPHVCAVIPALNEEATIADVVERCRAAGAGQVLVVDDGSRDQTAVRAREAGAVVLSAGLPGERPRGKGVAIRVGFARADADVIVTLDGDGQDPPEELPTLVAAIDAGAELAIGSRFAGTFGPGAITRIDRLGNRALSLVFAGLYGRRLADTQAGFRALARSLLARLDLRARGFEIEVEILAKALRVGAQVVEVPVARCARMYGTSRLRRVRDGARILAAMGRLRVGF